jgi:hypothetical protein
MTRPVNHSFTRKISEKTNITNLHDLREHMSNQYKVFNTLPTLQIR